MPFLWRRGGIDVATGIRTQVAKISQVDATGMSDAEKAKIPSINRLHSEPTAAESKFLAMLARGSECMDDPEYRAACKALEKERGE